MKKILLGLLLWAPFFAPAARADEVRADSGQVPWSCRIVDPSGRPIPQAEVFALEIRPGRRLNPGSQGVWDRVRDLNRLGSSDSQGLVATESLRAGHYDLGVRAKGFAPTLRLGVEVGPGSGDPGTQPVEIAMPPAALARGKVVDENGQGIAGAALHLDIVPASGRRGGLRGYSSMPPVAVTGAGGEFSFAETEAKTLFDLIARKPGYVAEALRGVTLENGEPLLFRLSRGARLEGRVASGGQPVAGAILGLEILEMVDRGGQEVDDRLAVAADAQGGYTIEAIGPGRYRLHANTRAGYQSWQSESFELKSGDRKTFDVELAKAATVFGKVLLPGGEPLPDAQVYFEKEGAAPPKRAMTGRADALGQYRITTAIPGPGRLTIRSEGHRDQVRRVRLAEGANEIDLTFELGGFELTARLSDGDGQPVAGAQVALSGPLHRQAASDTDGKVRLAQLPPDVYTLRIEKKGFSFISRQIEVTGSRDDLEWRLLSTPARIRGRVAGLEPAQQVHLQVSAQSTAPSSPGVRGSCENGWCTVEGLSAGSWDVGVSSEAAGALLRVRVEIPEGRLEVEQDFDFGKLGGPWVAQFHQQGKPARDLRYSLAAPSGRTVFSGSLPNGRIELRVAPGPYVLKVYNRQVSQQLQIEVGPPSEQVIEIEAP